MALDLKNIEIMRSLVVFVKNIMKLYLAKPTLLNAYILEPGWLELWSQVSCLLSGQHTNTDAG